MGTSNSLSEVRPATSQGIADETLVDLLARVESRADPEGAVGRLNYPEDLSADHERSVEDLELPLAPAPLGARVIVIEPPAGVPSPPEPPPSDDVAPQAEG